MKFKFLIILMFDLTNFVNQIEQDFRYANRYIVLDFQFSFHKPL